MACVVCVVFFLDPRIRNVHGNPVAHPRKVLFTSSRRGFLLRLGTVGLAHWSTADRVELRFRGSKGDQFRKGAVISRVLAGWPRSVGAGGGAVDLMLELISCYLFLPSSTPLVAYRSGGGRWSMWTKQQATVALRKVIALEGVQADEYALHSLRIGGATHLSAGGASPEALQRRPTGRMPAG